MTRGDLLRARVLLAGAGVVAVLVASAHAQQPGDPERAVRVEQAAAALSGPAIASHRGYRATHLFGATVHNRRGDAIGSVEDLVIDTCSGEVRHAVLTVGEGLLPGGGRQLAVPVGSLRGQVVGAIESPVDRLLLDIDPQHVARLSAARSSVAPARRAAARARAARCPCAAACCAGGARRVRPGHRCTRGRPRPSWLGAGRRGARARSRCWSPARRGIAC
ncbi:MAG: PRC-barrel domain-containing protein [Methylibium sp.]|uniref:PRC-barrel domain-containing protein n=1 Tax=Methylibium sp. TaxID=2067992 RepID=UPI0017DEDBB9|nr:PRC-barrel domain-containing protein [Methylibium sp.]